MNSIHVMAKLTLGWKKDWLTELSLVGCISASWPSTSLGAPLSSSHWWLHILLHLLILLILLLILLCNRCCRYRDSTLVLWRHHALVLNRILVMTQFVGARATLQFVTLRLVLLEVIVHLRLHLVGSESVINHDYSHAHTETTVSSNRWHSLSHLLLHA